MVGRGGRALTLRNRLLALPDGKRLAMAYGPSIRCTCEGETEPCPQCKAKLLEAWIRAHLPQGDFSFEPSEAHGPERS
jgi:hypothetical protein